MTGRLRRIRHMRTPEDEWTERAYARKQRAFVRLLLRDIDKGRWDESVVALEVQQALAPQALASFVPAVIKYCVLLYCRLRNMTLERDQLSAKRRWLLNRVVKTKAALRLVTTERDDAREQLQKIGRKAFWASKKEA